MDATIQLHEILIDPTKIAPIRVYRDRSDFQYGEMTRLIYSFLAEAQSSGLTTSQVVDLMIAKKGFIISDKNDYLDLRERIRCRLKNLFRNGRIDKVKSATITVWFNKTD